MIAFIRGSFVHKTPAVVHVEANGVGYELQISLNTYSAIQSLEKGMLYVHLSIREDAHILYGFSDIVEKELFLHLISVSGVGAATARMMLSSVKPDELVIAIATGNTKLLESIKGIGKKSAERIVLELRDKLSKSRLDANITSSAYNSVEQDALNALMALGIARAAGEQAVQKVIKAEPGLSLVEEIIKKALKTL
ncbi:Holliday junction branch migration protein RuvA [Pseudoflavitalea sp. G-6-1-2]|uniref:Holliday junction branch migration protein RuvA n=1 Tax=Pseudoflavitalea sp. G-6-1-2 TaxID=2728841 RepID=UPI00146BB450|nr:Holliday junction branch migration protein RuvA [Pseudoflavitalea sp. G-6-1-2]NML22690.1 Holliday junction branch migration protein RuvA [Pseudoflavitalea sp. G-6-1-2]